MKKQILAVAVAGAFAVPAFAAADSSVTLFGQVKYEVGLMDVVTDDDGSSQRNLVHATTGTRLGIDVNHDLGNGLTATARLQGNLGSRSDEGTGFDNTNWGMNENAWVGLTGDFGRLRVGRADTAVKEANKGFRAFNDTLADDVTIPAGWGRAQGIHYNSPSFGGVTIGATIEPNGNKTDAYYALNVQYNQGPIRVTAAIEDAPSADDGGIFRAQRVGEDETNYQVGALYNFGPGNVGLLYQARNDGDDDVFTLPVTYDVTSNVTLRAAVQHSRPDEGDNTTNAAVGAIYKFSDRTDAWVNVWKSDLSGDTQVDELADETHVSVGLRHSF